MRTSSALAALVALLAGSAQACEQPTAVALMPGTKRPVVMTQIDGQDAPMLVDTGAQRTLIDSDAATRLGVWRDTWVAMTMQGVGGSERQRVADLQSFSLGGVTLERRSVGARQVVAVGQMPPIREAIGLLGMDMLGPMGLDLNLDPRNRLLTLYPSGAGCTPLPVPSNAAVIATGERGGHLLVSIELNRQPITAILDTGADRTLITQSAAGRLGVTVLPPTSDPPILMSGIGPETQTLNTYRVDLTVSGMERNADFPILVGNFEIAPGIEMLLGADWMSTHRLLIDGPAHRLAVAPTD